MNVRQVSFYSIIVLLCSSIYACQTIEEPRLLSFTPVSIEKINTSEVILSAKVTFFNSNPLGGTLNKVHLNVFANEVHISDISQKLNIEVKSQSNFDVPIDIRIPLKSILNKESGFLGGLVNALTQRKVKLTYSGTATVNFAKMELNLPIEKEEEVSISL